MFGADIGGDYGECEIGQEVTKLIIATIEFVVAEGHSIESELIDGLGNLLSLVVGVEKGALELITSIEPQRVLMLGAELVNCMFDPSVSAIATTRRVGAVGTRRGELVQMSVDVIDVEEGCLIGLGQYAGVSRGKGVIWSLTHHIVAICIEPTLAQVRAHERILVHLLRAGGDDAGGSQGPRTDVLLHPDSWWTSKPQFRTFARLTTASM